MILGNQRGVCHEVDWWSTISWKDRKRAYAEEWDLSGKSEKREV